MAHHRLKGQSKPKKVRGPNVKKTATVKRDKRRALQKKEARRRGVPLSQYTKTAKEKERAERAEGKDQAAAPADKAGKEDLNRTAAGRAADKKVARQTRINAKQHQNLYDMGQRILVVGDGNLSFSRALCQNFETGNNVYATCYDGEAALHKKYADAKDNRDELDKLGATTLVGVDATRLHEVKAFRGAFQRIVFNFPHLGHGEADVEKSVADHVQLLTEFFKSAEKCLDPKASDASIHVSLKVGEPYKSWKVVQVGRTALPEEFDLQNAISFSFEAWPGYEHRRTVGFDQRLSQKDNAELAKGAKVYIFARKDAPRPGKRKKE